MDNFNFIPSSFPIDLSDYHNSYICGDTKITKNKNPTSYNYKFYVKLGEKSMIKITRRNEIKYEKLSNWISKHFSDSFSFFKPYDCIMELSNNSRFVFTIVNVKLTAKCNVVFYINSNFRTNSIFNIVDKNRSFKLPLKTVLPDVKFFIFEDFKSEDKLSIINANQQYLSTNTNNIKNGQLVSITKVGTILKNSIDLPGSDILKCPEQDITVYKILYWSSQNNQNGNQILSGSLLVPENVSKKEILQTKNGATFQYNDESILWYSLANGLDINNKSILNKSPLLFSGLGYIIVHADGQGLGESQGKVIANSDFYGEVNPHVDILRAVRTTLPIFSPIVSVDPLNIIYCGYSNGAIYGPSIVQQFIPNYHPNISSTEASKFNYTRLILGGCPCLTTEFFKTIQENPKNFWILQEPIGLLAWFLGNSNSGIMMSRPSAYNDIITPIAFGDELGRKNSLNLQQQFALLVKLNTLMHLPNNRDVYLPAKNLIVDIRQFIDINNAVLYGSEFINNHGWINRKIRLSNFPTIPITMVYSAGDQIVAPTVGSDQEAIFKKISNALKPPSSTDLPTTNSKSLTVLGDLSAYTFDGAAYLDDYMGQGKVIGILGNDSMSITFPGANKTVTVNNELNDKTQSGVKEIASLIKNTTGNNYVRIKIKTGNSRDFDILNKGNFGRASHSGNSITWMEASYYALQ